jgi:autotransporter-associated beta strand protein
MQFPGLIWRSNGASFAECTILLSPRCRATLLAGTAFTGVFIAAMTGSPQRALAACAGVNTASVTCDAGNQATLGALNTTFAGTTVVNVNPDGKIDTGGAFASVTALGSLTFNNNDTTFGITNIAFTGVALVNSFGAVTYLGNAGVTASNADAINVVTSTAAGNITITNNATVSGKTAGIVAQANGGGDVTVTGAGSVSSTSGVGISAVASGGNGNVLVGPTGTVTGTLGIQTSVAGSGTSTVNIAHDVTGTANNGVLVATAAGLGTVNVSAGTIRGALSAVSASSSLGGDINVAIGTGAVLQGGSNFGLFLAGTNNIVVNGGTITGTGGLSAIGVANVVINAGSITGTGGIAVGLQGSNSLFVMAGADAALTGRAIANGNAAFRFAGSAANSFDVSQIGTGWTLLDKTGTSNWTLTGTSTYAGPVTVNGGTLSVNGNLSSASSLVVNSGSALGGNGTVGTTTINGGALAPGNSIGTLTVAGNLTFTAAASYMVEVSPASADRTNVTGTAALGGATVNASFAAGTYVAKQYTILNATGGLGGSTFGSVVNTNLPSGFKSNLSYDSSNAFLNLALDFTPPPSTPNFGGGLTGNQQAVGNALINFFNTTGGIPIVFGTLAPSGLTQLSGEAATGSQQTTFNAMNQFMGVMTDPFIAGRGDSISAGGHANAYAEASLAYAAKRKPEDALGAIYTKAPPIAPAFSQRWSVWAAGFGGSQTTDGNAFVGSNDTRSSIAGGAVGADYRFSPNTIAGFSMAGGGTNFSVANNLGSGRSDLFQAGAFVRHNAGPAYFTGALAYGWQDITTDRTVTVAVVDRLRAEFNANTWSGRVEGGYRFVSQGFGWTPYAAGQFTTFDLPAYAEQAIVGANTFALTYASKSVTDTRSELGLRTDKSFAMSNAILTLRGRAAWAHDFNPNRAIGATFQTLPGASFVVNGAAMASDSALVTGSAEMKWVNGWSAAATFEGEFSSVTRSYAGKGVVRYAW